MKTNPSALARLEKAGHDSGFDILGANDGTWLFFESSHCPLKIWLGSMDGLLVVAFSENTLPTELTSFGMPAATALPIGALSALSVGDFDNLYRLLRRAFQLFRALPSQPLIEFQKQTRGLPQATEVERLVIQRVGQDIFRERLFEFWDGKCAVTGLAIPALLRASHIKPWKDCGSDAERLDVFNGLLLAPHLDAAFDRGFISFSNDGALIVSRHLANGGLALLGIDLAAKCKNLTEAHHKYLEWHRANEFQAR